MPERFGQETTIGALSFALNHVFRANASLSLDANDNWELQVSGDRVQSHFFANTTAQISYSCAYMLNMTQIGMPDPFIGLLRDLNSFAFVTALYLTGAPLATPQNRPALGLNSFNFTSDVSGYTQAYQTNYHFLAGAIAATFFSMLCVLPVYWGYWELGRNVSLDPFEIAQAFGAPMLMDHQQKTKQGYVSEVLKEDGTTKVRFGRVLGERKGQLGIDREQNVVAPQHEVGGEEGSGGKRGFASEVALGVAGVAVGVAVAQG